MNFQPKVSIIIPVYNGSNFLSDAINSAINQTYKNIEIIVVNDGSNDDNKTEKLALSYKDKIKYIKKENGGVASALNLGIQNMTGEYFSWLSHDDLYGEKKIENQINILRNLEDKTTLICCRHCVVDANLNYMYENSFEDNADTLFYPALKCLFKGYIHGCGMLIHKSHFKRVGLFNENLPTTQDYDLWFRMLRNKEIYLNNNIDVKSRCHENQGSKKLLDKHIKECDKLWINIINTLTDKEKKEIYGSNYNFYKEIYTFLNNNTAYDDCIIYIKKLYAEELKKKIINNEIDTQEAFGFIKDRDIQSILKKPKQKKRILFGDYGEWQDLGGVNRVISNISNLLCDYYDVYILANGVKDIGYKLDDKITYLNIDPSSIYNINLEELSLLLVTLDIDIHIGVHNCWGFILDIYKRLKKDHIKNIAWNHEFYFLPYWNSLFYSALANRIETFKEVEACFWLTSFNAKVYNNLANNGIIMPNPISWEKPENVAYKRPNKNIVSIARFDDNRKCLDKLLQVFSKVLEKEPEAKLYIVGNYNLEMLCNNDNITIKELIKKLKIPESNMIFTGFIKDIDKLLKDMNVNVVTSYHEAFGLVINEASSYKIPTIAFNDSGFEDLIKENETGYLVFRNNEEEMAEKIVRLLKNPELCEKLGENAYNKCDEYLPEKIKEKWIDILDTIINTENKEDLYKYYQKYYSIEEKYDKSFVKNIINQYETSIKRILNTQNNITPIKLATTETQNIETKTGFKYNIYNRLKKHPIIFKITRTIYHTLSRIALILKKPKLDKGE